MLDGLLGRSGFYSKCKSLIKQARTRIEAVRRKRNATHNFLRKDVADLLANGLDTNAFARADGLITELILTSCYEFVDHVCEIILKHLPVLQKLRECPEDCREAVASLMFAAARFSDVPELRDLRDLFQERYGSSLEFYVNQKLVENISTKPPTVEKKIQFLQEIALEYSIRWDSKKFQERMSKSVTEQKPQNSPGTLSVAKNKVSTPPAVATVQRTVKDETLTKKKTEASYRNTEREIDGRHQKAPQWDTVPGEKFDLKHKGSKSPEITSDRNKPPSYKEGTTQKLDDRDIPFRRREHKAGVHDFKKYTTSIKDTDQMDTTSQKPERELPNIFAQQKPDPRPTSNGINLPPSAKNELAENSHVKAVINRESDVADVQKSHLRGGIPPPYMKPRKNKHNTDEQNDTLTFNPGSNGNRAENLQTKADRPDTQDGTLAPENGDGPARFTEIYYKDESIADFAPRRRSHRRRHSRSASTQDDEVNGEDRVLRRVSTSRRKNGSKKGLQILVADEEEKMIDKLLLHYSKTPSSADPGITRRKTSSSKSPHHHQSSVGTHNDEDLTLAKSRRKANLSKSPHHLQSSALDGTDMDEDSTLTKSRSFCVSSREMVEPKQEKVFTRAASFQDTPAKHVHPKLPDYDDLAARFAALRAAKG